MRETNTLPRTSLSVSQVIVVLIVLVPATTSRGHVKRTGLGLAVMVAAIPVPPSIVVGWGRRRLRPRKYLPAVA